MEEVKEVKEPTLLVTYKFYDERGRRLSIFGKPMKDSLDIYVVTCGTKDRFTKRKANLIYKGRSAGDSGKGAYLVPLKDAKKSKHAFMKWCEENYYKRTLATFEFDAYVLVKGEDILSYVEPVTFPGNIKPKDIQEPKKEAKDAI